MYSKSFCNSDTMRLSVYFLSIFQLVWALPHSVLEPPEELEDLPDSRIIGGNEVLPNSIPYQAAVLINGSFVCGGSLISTTAVLTAAHCTIEASFVVVVLGAHALNSPDEATQVRLTSTNIVNHEGYTVFLENDVAVVLLPSPVTLTDAIQTVPLAPSSAPSYEDAAAYLTGWGMTADGSGVSPVLRGVSLSVISNEECALRYIFIRPSNICTSGEGVVGACHSDSGGPLVVQGVQVGIVGFGSGSCLDESPTGYTRVSSFREWIQDKAGV